MAEKARASRCLKAAVLAAIAGFLLAAGEAHAARPAIKDVTAAGLLGPPGAVHDTLLARRPAAPGSASYATPDGERVAVDVSAGYAETPARVQELVDFLGTLVHSHELGRLSVSIRTSDELHGICGFAADACYSPALMRMIIPGEDLPHVSLEHLLAHEYGHHVLANQRNEPWDASSRGGKRWATHENVCALTAAGEAFPGDEGDHYRLNPGEGFAEAFRVANAARAATWPVSAWIVDPRFYPDAAATRLLEADVLDPLERPRTVRRTLRLGARGERHIRVSTAWDGVLHVSAPHARIKILDASRRPLSPWIRRGRHVICGTRSVVVAVRAATAGRYAVRITRP